MYFRGNTEQVRAFVEDTLVRVGRGFYLQDAYAVYKEWYEKNEVHGPPLGKNTFSGLLEVAGFDRAVRMKATVVRFEVGGFKEGVVVPPRPEPFTTMRRNWKDMNPELRAVYRREIEEGKRKKSEERKKAREEREARCIMRKQEKLQEQEKRIREDKTPLRKSLYLRRLLGEI